MTQKHTPTPWDIQNKGLGVSVNNRSSARVEVVQGINLDGSTDLPKIARMPDLSDRSYANARFIVQACNAHEDLLAALEGLHKEMTAVPAKAWLHLDAEVGEAIDRALETAWAAIAKATGPQAQ